MVDANLVPTLMFSSGPCVVLQVVLMRVCRTCAGMLSILHSRHIHADSVQHLGRSNAHILAFILVKELIKPCLVRSANNVVTLYQKNHCV